jgi:hypothetical protein
MRDNETASHYWSLANNVSVFAVVQMIAYLMAVGAVDSDIRQGVTEIRTEIEIAIAAATVLYCGAVWYFSHCHWLLLGSIEREVKRMLRVTAILRLLVIVAAGVGGFYITDIIQPVDSAPVGATSP